MLTIKIQFIFPISYRECSFLSKSIVADRAGALMLIIFDSDEKNDYRFIDMIDDDTKRSTSIPVAFMQGRDG